MRRTTLSLDSNVGAVVHVGTDFRLTDHWYANVDYKQIFLNTTASLNSGFIHAKTALNPAVFGAGIGYCF